MAPVIEREAQTDFASIVGRSLYFDVCPKCCGSLYQDCDEWACRQCGGRIYPTQPNPTLLTGRRRRRSYALDDINVVITAQERGKRRWEVRNREAIRQLQEGRSIKEVSKSIGSGVRQVRGVQERLRDNRVVES